MAAAVAMMASASLAQEDSDPFAHLTPVDPEGFCVLDGPWDRYDPQRWRQKYKADCWFPVHPIKSVSEYFIKVFDFGSAPPRPIISAPTYKSPSIEIWVQGLHERDKAVRYRKSVTLYRFVCGIRVNRYAAVQFIGYGSGGAIMEQWERPSTQARPAVPGTKEEAFADAICR